MKEIQIYLIYLLVINLVTLFSFLIDKIKAKRNSWRIPEKTLLTLCLLGGALGGLFGMMLFRHKTRKWTFVFSVPLLVIIYLAITLLLIFY